MFGIPRVISNQVVEIAANGLCYCKKNRVVSCEEEVGVVRLRGENAIPCKREKVFESEGKREFESGKDGIHEMVCRVREGKEEKAL